MRYLADPLGVLAVAFGLGLLGFWVQAARADDLVATRSRYGQKVRLWAVGEGVHVDPESGRVFEEDIPGAVAKGYRRRNWIWDGRRARLDSAGNEVVAFQIVIEGAGLRDVRVELAGLKGPAGRIARSNIDLFRQWYVWLKKSGVTTPTIKTNMSVALQRISTRDGWYPDALIPLGAAKFGNGFAIPSTDFSHPDKHPFRQRNQAVWVDVFVPPGAKPGAYTGEVVVTGKQGDAAAPFKATLPIALKVWPVTLPNEDHMTFELMTYAGLKGAEGLKLYQLIHRHRLTIGCKGLTPEVIGKGTKDARFDWTEFDRQWSGLFDGTAFKTGPGKGKPVNHIILRFDHSWPGGYGRPGFDKTYARLMKDWAEHFKKKGWTKTELIVWSDTLDEPLGYRVNKSKALKQVADLKNFARLVRAAGYERMLYRLDIGTGFWYCRYDLDGDGKAGTTDLARSREVVRALTDSTDVWNVHGYCINVAALRPQLQSGKARHGWFYNGYDPRVGHSAINSEGVGSRTWPWVVWVSGLTGVCDWHFMYNKQRRNLFRQASQDDFPGRACYVYNGRQLGLARPIGSMRLKAMRRGKQDYEYLRLLSEKTGSRAKANQIALRVVWQTLGRPANTIALPKGSDDLRAKAAAATKAGSRRTTREKCARCWSHAPADFHQARMKLLELLAAE